MHATKTVATAMLGVLVGSGQHAHLQRRGLSALGLGATIGAQTRPWGRRHARFATPPHSSQQAVRAFASCYFPSALYLNPLVPPPARYANTHKRTTGWADAAVGLIPFILVALYQAHRQLAPFLGRFEAAFASPLYRFSLRLSARFTPCYPKVATCPISAQEVFFQRALSSVGSSQKQKAIAAQSPNSKSDRWKETQQLSYFHHSGKADKVPALLPPASLLRSLPSAPTPPLLFPSCCRISSRINNPHPAPPLSPMRDRPHATRTRQGRG